MAGIADDIVAHLTALSSVRADHEWSWNQIAKIAAPDAGDFSTSISGMAGLPTTTAARRSKDIYDTTAVNSVDRLASGIEALIVPQSEYWHTMSITDFTTVERTDYEKRWLEDLRNLLFKVRYDADSGWIPAVQTCLRRLVQFGNAFMFVEEGGRKSMVRYRYLPLEQCYATEDAQGAIDGFLLFYTLTARQAVQRFGNKVSAKVRKAAETPADMERRFRFIHAIRPRSDFGFHHEGVMRAPWSSIHVEYEEKHFIYESGFYEFPIVDFRWLPEPGRVYGEGPVQKCLADIQSLNEMAKNELISSQQAIDPPLLVANAGVMNRPNTNPGSVNIGGMTPTGQKLIEPLFTGQRLDFATNVLEAKRNQVKESMYINLFALLVKNPEMSATEAMIRANEKGELLGPAGARIQQGLSGNVERELGLLSRKGLYARGSAYTPPRSLVGRNAAAQFEGPLSRLRRTKEAEGTVRTLQVMAPLAQVDQTVVDNFDSDAMARGLGEVFGMPSKFIRPKDAVDAKRAQRAQQQQYAQAAAVAKDAASAGKQGTDALVNLQRTAV